MSNLGPYQDIVIDAKAVGGVPNYLRQVEIGAVAEAAPRIFGKGAIVGALATGATYVIVRKVQAVRRRKIEQAEHAKAVLGGLE